MKELNQLPSPAPYGLTPSPNSLHTWHATLQGREHTHYAGQILHLLITIPLNYPSAPPSMKFQPPIFHPNVNAKTGEICLDLLKERWTASVQLEAAVVSVEALLEEPGVESPWNVDANALWLKDRRAYGDVVKCFGRLVGSLS